MDDLAETERDGELKIVEEEKGGKMTKTTLVWYEKVMIEIGDKSQKQKY